MRFTKLFLIALALFATLSFVAPDVSAYYYGNYYAPSYGAYYSHSYFGGYYPYYGYGPHYGSSTLSYHELDRTLTHVENSDFLSSYTEHMSMTYDLVGRYGNQYSRYWPN